MSERPSDQSSDRRAASWVTSLVISSAILLVAGGLVAVTFFTEPEARKAGAAKTTAMLVDVVEAEAGSFRPRIEAQGTVEPARDIVLNAQIEGRIVEMDNSFVPGGFVEEGELLARIEPADYRNALAQRKSELQQAKSDLAIERGRREAAKIEYDYVDEELSEENKALVLREPQLESAKASIDSAEAAVDQAELNLSRTRIEAPFDAHIVRREVNVGSQVAPGQDMGRLVGVDTYWVGVEVPLSKLRWLTIADDAEAASRVRVQNDKAWPEDAYRTGHLFKKVGVLDENTRMARVLAAIPDPLVRAEEPPDRPELTIGEFLDVEIEGDELTEVIRLNRDYIREESTVWVMEEEKLQIHSVEIVMQDAEHAYIAEGLEAGDKVVTTTLSTVSEGAALRTEADDQPREKTDGEKKDGGGASQ